MKRAEKKQSKKFDCFLKTLFYFFMLFNVTIICSNTSSEKSNNLFSVSTSTFISLIKYEIISSNPSSFKKVFISSLSILFFSSLISFFLFLFVFLIKDYSSISTKNLSQKADVF